jgi:hypothetical protein
MCQQVTTAEFFIIPPIAASIAGTMPRPRKDDASPIIQSSLYMLVLKGNF